MGGCVEGIELLVRDTCSTHHPGRLVTLAQRRVKNPAHRCAADRGEGAGGLLRCSDFGAASIPSLRDLLVVGRDTPIEPDPQPFTLAKNLGPARPALRPPDFLRGCAVARSMAKKYSFRPQSDISTFLQGTGHFYFALTATELFRLLGALHGPEIHPPRRIDTRCGGRRSRDRAFSHPGRARLNRRSYDAKKRSARGLLGAQRQRWRRAGRLSRLRSGLASARRRRCEMRPASWLGREPRGLVVDP